MYQIITLYTLNLHNVICQLYLNKAGEKRFCISQLFQPLPITSSKAASTLLGICYGSTPLLGTNFYLSLFRLCNRNRLGGLNNRCSFLTVLEAGSLRSGGQHGRILVEGPLPCVQMATSSHLFAWQRERARQAL